LSTTGNGVLTIFHTKQVFEREIGTLVLFYKGWHSSLLDAGRMTTQLGTPRGRYDEYNSKFSHSKKPRFIVSRKKPNSRR
jgi:hypothetical protein